MSTDTIIGRNLKAYREKNGFTQKAAAGYLGVNREQISYYETGAREVPIDALSKLSDLYGTEMSEFFEEDEHKCAENVAIAFRTEGLAQTDINTIAKFKAVVKNYLKMNNLLGTL